MKKTLAFTLLLLVSAVPLASAAEPNEDFATATGPLTAGQTFKASLETETDLDFQFFYLPDTTTLTVTTINAAKSRGRAEDRGRTILSSLQRARKGKTPLVVPNSAKGIAPGKKASVKLTLLPGKYFIPIGRIPGATPQPNVPFRLRIGPVGSTTDSFEVFEQRCAAARRYVDRVTSSIERTSDRIKKAKQNDAPTSKVVKLKLKLKDKRAKAKAGKKAEKFACSIPQ